MQTPVACRPAAVVALRLEDDGRAGRRVGPAGAVRVLLAGAAGVVLAGRQVADVDLLGARGDLARALRAALHGAPFTSAQEPGVPPTHCSSRSHGPTASGREHPRS